jgi:YidC/Oxa1 family membrane protein insertase
VSFLFDGIAGLLNFFYSLIPNYGFAIIMLTLLVMVVMTPLTLKGTKSMMAMQRLQPEMKKIQEKYKDDREKLNEELLAFYRENNINPVGGCLPLFLQMPIFIVLYRVIAGLTLPASALGVQTGWVSGQLGTGTTPTEPPSGVMDQPFDPAYLDPSSELYQSLAGQYTMPFLGLDLAESASQALGRGVVHSLPYLVMIGLVAVTGWYQQRQMQARSSGPPNPQQQTISRVMLIFLPAISFGLPAGVVLYFIVSNLYRVGQQAYITRTMYKGQDPIPLAEPEPTTKSKKSPAKSGSKSTEGARPTKPPTKGKSSSGRVTPPKSKPSAGGNGSNAKSGRSSKTFTSDPSRRSSSGASAPSTPPRPRKKRK